MNVYTIIRFILILCIIISCIKLSLGIAVGQSLLAIGFSILALVGYSDE